MRNFYLRTLICVIPSLIIFCCEEKDAGLPCTDKVWYRDQDGDGRGDKLYYLYSCNVQPEGFVADNTDNDDNLPCPEAITFYADKDGDGKGDPNDPISACEVPDGYVDNDEDDVDWPAGGSIELVSLPATGTDDAIGINASKTYTHAFDFGTGPVASINGVTFEQVLTEDLNETLDSVSSFGYGYSIGDTRDAVSIRPHSGNDESQSDGNSADLFQDMIYHSNSGSDAGIVVTFKDLTSGNQYSVRFYYRSWSPGATRPILFQGDGANNGVFDGHLMEVDIDENSGAFYLDYTFTADDTDATVKFITQTDGQGVHLYGLTCEEVD